MFGQIILHFLWSHEPIAAPHLKAFLQFDQLISAEKCVIGRLKRRCVSTDALDWCRMNHFVKPLLDRKMLKPLEYRKLQSQYCWALNMSFKMGLRNALTGLYVLEEQGVLDRKDRVLTGQSPFAEEHPTRSECRTREDRMTQRSRWTTCLIMAKRLGRQVSAGE